MKTGYQFRSNGSSLDTESNYTQKQPYSVLAQPRPRRIQRTVSTSPLSVCHSGSSILAIFMVIISLLNVVSAQDDFLHQIARRGQSFVDLGARRLMERAAASTTASPSTSTTTSTSAIASATSTTLPQPFDTTLGNNFTTTSCPTFIVNFLSDITFQQCYPFSLLLQVSRISYLPIMPQTNHYFRLRMLSSKMKRTSSRSQMPYKQVATLTSMIATA